MQFFSDHSIKDWTSVSDSSKPTLASIGKLTVISSANLTRRFLSVLIALISLIKIESLSQFNSLRSSANGESHTQLLVP